MRKSRNRDSVYVIAEAGVNHNGSLDLALLTPTVQVDPERGQISMAGQRGITVDRAAYERAMEGQRERARKARKSGGVASGDEVDEVAGPRAGRVARLVELGVPPRSILLLTFTRRAAQEMLRRS